MTSWCCWPPQSEKSLETSEMRLDKVKNDLSNILTNRNGGIFWDRAEVFHFTKHLCTILFEAVSPYLSFRSSVPDPPTLESRALFTVSWYQYFRDDSFLIKLFGRKQNIQPQEKFLAQLLP